MLNYFKSKVYKVYNFVSIDGQAGGRGGGLEAWLDAWETGMINLSGAVPRSKQDVVVEMNEKGVKQARQIFIVI